MCLDLFPIFFFFKNWSYKNKIRFGCDVDRFFFLLFFFSKVKIQNWIHFIIYFSNDMNRFGSISKDYCFIVDYFSTFPSCLSVFGFFFFCQKFHSEVIVSHMEMGIWFNLNQISKTHLQTFNKIETDFFENTCGKFFFALKEKKKKFERQKRFRRWINWNRQ